MQGSVPIDNALKHGLNNLVILADFVLMRMPVASYHFQVRRPSCHVVIDAVSSIRCWQRDSPPMTKPGTYCAINTVLLAAWLYKLRCPVLPFILPCCRSGSCGMEASSWCSCGSIMACQHGGCTAF